MQDTSYEASSDEIILHEQPHFSKISLPTFSSTPIIEKRSSYTKELSAKKHPEVNRNVSLEDKVKSYQDNVVSYREQCQTLKEEKAALLKTKQDLENEVTQLRDELEGLSFSSTFSQQTRHSQSCSSLYSLERTERDTEPQVKQRSRTLSEKFLAESKLFASGRSRITSFLKGTAKKTSRTIMPLEALESTSHEASAVTLTLPENINKDYLDPLHQGWLLKEGGQKKYWKKRWCLLSSRFFFYYFEGMEDPSLNKRPTGILPITKEMAVDDSLKENHFAIYNTRKNSMMKSCKLDKSKGNYVQGHHAVYNLQAYSDGEKKKWIEMFQFVFEQLKQ